MEYLFGDCILVPSRRELTRGGARVHVEPQVFDLLLFLVENRNRVVSKDDILAAVWNGRIVSESTITNRINSARAAVGDSGAKQVLIRTVARKGLHFIGNVEERGGPSAPGISVPAVLQGNSRPAIAVLPFDNFSADPEQDYFADGITEDLITALAAWRSFPVIARNSTFTFKGKPKNVKDVGAELGASYVVEGSVRRSGEKVRITAQLIESGAGHHLWANKFDCDLPNIFSLQDRIISEIVTHIEPQLNRAESLRVERKPPERLDAWDLCLKSLWHIRRANTADYELARGYLDRAISLEPTSSLVHSLSALWHFDVALLGWTKQPTTAFVSTFNAAQTALAIDESDWMAHALMGIAVLWTHRDYELSIQEEQRAVALNPSGVLGQHFLGCALMYGDRPREAIPHLEQVLRFDPRHQSAAMIFGDIALPHILVGEYQAATVLCERGLAKDANNARTLQKLVVARAMLGEVDAAKQAFRRLKEIQPGFSLSYVDATYPFRNPKDRRLWVEGFRRAGLEE